MEKEIKRRRPKVGRLTTVGEVAAELGRVYRLARWKQIDPQDATRFATLLSAMRQCLEASDVERRLAELEAELEVDSNVVKFPGRGAA